MPGFRRRGALRFRSLGRGPSGRNPGPPHGSAHAHQPRRCPRWNRALAFLWRNGYSLVTIGAVVGAGLPANNRATASRARSAPTQALARTGVQHSCSTGGVHRFRGSAPQIKSGAGSAREALSPVRSPAGRLPQKHWLVPACNTVAPQGRIGGSSRHPALCKWVSSFHLSSLHPVQLSFLIEHGPKAQPTGFDIDAFSVLR